MGNSVFDDVCYYVACKRNRTDNSFLREALGNLYTEYLEDEERASELSRRLESGFKSNLIDVVIENYVMSKKLERMSALLAGV